MIKKEVTKNQLERSLRQNKVPEREIEKMIIKFSNKYGEWCRCYKVTGQRRKDIQSEIEQIDENAEGALDELTDYLSSVGCSVPENLISVEVNQGTSFQKWFQDNARFHEALENYKRTIVENEAEAIEIFAV